jgi:hypothetical protein
LLRLLECQMARTEALFASGLRDLVYLEPMRGWRLR